MTDIVDKLRDCGAADNETYRACLEAAAEIERLRREIERLRRLLRETLTGETHGDWMMRVREAIGD